MPEGELQRFRTHFAPFFAEFTADEHPADEAYLRDIGSERPSPAAQARELWLQTENLWVFWPSFIDALRAEPLLGLRWGLLDNVASKPQDAYTRLQLTELIESMVPQDGRI